MNYNDHLPQTIEQAVSVLLEQLSTGEKYNIAAMSRDGLINLHFGLGTSIRNDFGLWSGNTTLLESTGNSHPDDAAMTIIEALWHRLNNA
ncbi:MAG: hypothetical protein Q8R84_10980 [Candidatus Nitrotoga sp.]|nr:hypothetical protein [Candidatus Nitrotoga sp.]